MHHYSSYGEISLNIGRKSSAKRIGNVLMIAAIGLFHSALDGPLRMKIVKFSGALLRQDSVWQHFKTGVLIMVSGSTFLSKYTTVTALVPGPTFSSIYRLVLLLWYKKGIASLRLKTYRHYCYQIRMDFSTSYVRWSLKYRSAASHSCNECKKIHSQ